MKRISGPLVIFIMLLTAQPALAYPCETDPLTCFRVDLSGPVTTNRTQALMGVNSTDGQGNGVAAGNLGVFGVAHGSGPTSTATYNTGVVGQGRWGATLSVGVEGLGVDTDGVSTRSNANVIGVYGRGQTNGSGFSAGGYFTNGATEPIVNGPGAALIVDLQPGGRGDAVSIRVNGTPVITVAADGTLTFNQGVTACPPSVPVVMGPPSCIRVRTTNSTYYIPAYQ